MRVLVLDKSQMSDGLNSLLLVFPVFFLLSGETFVNMVLCEKVRLSAMSIPDNNFVLGLLCLLSSLFHQNCASFEVVILPPYPS